MKSTNRNKPIFSIVIATYNATETLRECINSLYDQSTGTKCFEVIVVNDGGKDKISESLGHLSDELAIKYFDREHRGPAAARNFGINQAKGDIILFLDDDSLPTRNWLSAVIEAWEKFPNADGIGGYIKAEVTDSIYCRVNSDFFNWYLEEYSDDEFHPFLVTCNAGYTRNILEKVGNFDERFKKPSGEDRDLNIKISRIGGELRLNRSIVVYHDRDLTFRSFAKKHYNYGKGAYSIYARYPELKRMSTTAYINLYISIVTKYKTIKDKITAFLLLTVSQLATIIGYYTAALLKLERRN